MKTILMSIALLTVLNFSNVLAFEPNTNQQDCDQQANIYFLRMLYDCNGGGQFMKIEDAKKCFATTETITKLYSNVECEAHTPQIGAMFYIGNVKWLNVLAKDYIDTHTN